MTAIARTLFASVLCGSACLVAVAHASTAACPVPLMTDQFGGFFPPNPFGTRAWPAATACVAAKHDALIVLGCPNEKDGRPSKCQRKRADLAMALSRSGYGDYFIVTGASVHSPGVEADSLARLLMERGVPRERIVLEPRARHTDENLYYSDLLMAERGWQSALIVTESPGQLLMTAVCDANCCVRRGRLTAMRFALRDGAQVKMGHYARYPAATPVSGAECRQIQRLTKAMCINLKKRNACAGALRLP